MCGGCPRATRLWGAAARVAVMRTHLRCERIYCKGASKYSLRCSGLYVRIWDLLAIVCGRLSYVAVGCCGLRHGMPGQDVKMGVSPES